MMILPSYVSLPEGNGTHIHDAFGSVPSCDRTAYHWLDICLLTKYHTAVGHSFSTLISIHVVDRLYFVTNPN